LSAIDIRSGGFCARSMLLRVVATIALVMRFIGIDRCAVAYRLCYP
jgi:hypothetical protein